MLESFKCSVREAITGAKELGAKGIQFYGVNGELDCDRLNKDDIEIFKSLLKQNSLKVSAICADMGGYGFEKSDDNGERIAKTCRVMELAAMLECDVVTSHIGVIPTNDGLTKQTMIDACKKIAQYGKLIQVRFAIETGPELCVTLKSFLEEVNSKYIGVNYDPANLVMVTGDNPVQGVYTLKNYIFHTHIKDGKMIKKTDPKIIYDYFAKGGIEDMRLGDYFEETPLGKGDVNLIEWIDALNTVGYNGYLTIERETGNYPKEDIKTAIEYLRSEPNLTSILV